MDKIKLLTVFFITALCFTSAKKVIAQEEVPDDFQRRLTQISNTYHRELERDNGKTILQDLDQLEEDEKKESGKFGLPASHYGKIRKYKDLTRGLKLFIASAAGKNTEDKYEYFQAAIDFLGLTAQLVRESPGCGKVYRVDFGTPK
jgi:hypothetical protein